MPPNLRLMFIDWQHAEIRLNKGVRGRIHDRLFYLMDRKQIDGFDVKAIWEETRLQNLNMKIKGQLIKLQTAPRNIDHPNTPQKSKENNNKRMSFNKTNGYLGLLDFGKRIKNLKTTGDVKLHRFKMVTEQLEVKAAIKEEMKVSILEIIKLVKVESDQISQEEKAVFEVHQAQSSDEDEKPINQCMTELTFQ